MTKHSLYQSGIHALRAANNKNAAFDAMCLLETCLNETKTSIFAHAADRVDEKTVNQYNNMVDRRSRGEPLQYVLGEWDFMGMPFSVGEGVLIPRPETELLVECAIRELPVDRKISVIDLCAGTGCVGISIAARFPNACVYMVEKSQSALTYLERNISRHNLGNTAAVAGDLFDGYLSFRLPEPAMILANPPYIPSAQIPRLQKEVLFEPSEALDGGNDGLKYYRAIHTLWWPFVKHKGALLMEFGDGQANAVSALFAEPSVTIEIRNDFNEMQRIISVKSATQAELSLREN